MKEEWKMLTEDYYPYSGYYEVSNTGKVRSLGRYVDGGISGLYWKDGRVLKTPLNKYGYKQVRISCRGKAKTFRVHRLVASSWVNNPKPEEYDTINHKDENKQNNNASNLEWCTQDYNVHYGTLLARSKHSLQTKDNNTKVPIIVVDSEGNETAYLSLRQVAKDLGIDRTTITARLQNPKVYGDSYKGYHFYYKDPNRTNYNKDYDVDGSTQGKNNPFRKQTLAEIQERVAKVHPNIIIGSDYENQTTKCTAYCSIHKSYFKIKVNSILSKGSNCPKCSLASRAQKRTISKDETQKRLDIMSKGNLVIENDYVGLSKPCTLLCNNCNTEDTYTLSILFNSFNCNGCKHCNRSRRMTITNMKREGYSQDSINKKLAERNLYPID